MKPRSAVKLQQRREEHKAYSAFLRILLWSVPALTGIYLLGGLLPPVLSEISADSVRFASAKVYGHFCHQLPDRSFSVAGVQFAFCARCSGFYGGLFVTCLFLQLKRRIFFPSWRLAMFLSLPILIDAVFDVSGHLYQPNLLRLGAGALAAIGIAGTFYTRWLAQLRRVST